MSNSTNDNSNNINQVEKKSTIILPKIPTKQSKNPFSEKNSKTGKNGKTSVISKPGNTWKKQ